MRDIIVGDVHGCIEELEELIKTVGLHPEDRWTFVGDLLDKGPDSPAVVRRVQTLPNVTLILGNHEENHANYRYREEQSRKFGTPNKMPEFKKEVIIPILEKLSQADLEFLDSAVLYHRISAHNALVVHAGVLPGLSELPSLGEFSAWPRGKQKQVKNPFIRLRYVRGHDAIELTVRGVIRPGVQQTNGVIFPDFKVGELGVVSGEVIKRTVKPAGEFLALGDEGPNDPYWAEIYDGRFGHVYFGHQPFSATVPPAYPHATALDLGCCHGGSLAGVVLEGNDCEFVTVKSKENYFGPINGHPGGFTW